MIKLENTEVLGWEAAIRGMRNPMNSWEKSDTDFIDGPGDGHNIFGGCFPCIYEGMFPGNIALGENDRKLMMNLAKAGSVDAKYRRMIVVTVDITAPLYWWKEFDTYKVGTVANSCSTMHKIHSKEFTLEDFSCEHLLSNGVIDEHRKSNNWDAMGCLMHIIDVLNYFRENYLIHKQKNMWWQMIQLLPSSYNQRRTVMLNYEVLAGVYPKRKDHKLDEWREFCDWIKGLPYSEIITLKEKEPLE